MSEYTSWTYCEVHPDGTIIYYGVGDDHQAQLRPNVHAVDTQRWVEEAVAWLGTQGWELVSVVLAEGDRTFYLKRPIRDQTADILAQPLTQETATATTPDLPVDDTPEITVLDPARLIEEEFLPE